MINRLAHSSQLDIYPQPLPKLLYRNNVESGVKVRDYLVFTCVQTPVVPAFPTCPTYLCAMCVGFDLSKGYYFQYASTLVNQRLHFDVFLPTSSRVCKVSIFQLRYSPFFYLVCFEVYLVLIG